MLSVATVVAAHALSSQPAPSDWLGTWAYEKDGFAFTAIFESDMDGAMVTRRLVLDENNREIARAIYTRDPDGRWRETCFNRQGDRATFEQRGNSEDALSLEMTGFNGTPEPVVQARTLHTPMPDGTLVVDWQSRAIDGGFTPRAVPYTYGRVDRPVAPTGDGRIAFISTRDGNWEIYTVNPDGTDLRNLTNSPATDHAPHWMAGGTRLSFRSTRETPDYELPEERGGWARWEIDADGTDAVLADMLIRGHSADFGTFPAVSPDGEWIAFESKNDDGSQIFLITSKGTSRRQLTHEGYNYGPAWLQE